LAIGGLSSPPLSPLSPPFSPLSPPFSPLSPPFSPLSPPLLPDLAARDVQLERVTVLGRIRCEVLNASECLLTEQAVVEDRQTGCIRFSRYERGSILPRRYRCVPSDESACAQPSNCLVPIFNSRRFGRPDYMQLATNCSEEILTASEAGAEVGAFAGLLNRLRLDNLGIKLREFLPAGLSAIVIAET
jgi:hypothetical protein